jgi:uncharacterized membrane protein YjjP (DUF1212 family)
MLGQRAALPGMDRYPTWLWWVSLLVASPVFAFFVWQGGHVRAFLSTLSIAVLVGMLVTLRDYRSDLLYWLVAFVAAVCHLSGILLLKSGGGHFPVVLLTPAAVIDLLIWQTVFVNLYNLANRRSA